MSFSIHSNNSFDRFSDPAIKVILHAQEEARLLGYNHVGSEHMLLGLLAEGMGIAARTLKSMGLNLRAARSEVEKITGRGSGFVRVELPFTPRCKKIVDYGRQESDRLDQKRIGTEHLLLGLIREAEECSDSSATQGVAFRVLKVLQIDIAVLHDAVLAAIRESETLKTTHAERSLAVETSIEFDFQSMLSLFTRGALEVMQLAQDEACRLGHNFVGTEQLLLGLIAQGTGIGGRALKSMGVNMKVARIEVEKIIGRGAGFVMKEIPFTPRCKRALHRSMEASESLSHKHIGTEHILLGLLKEGNGVALTALNALGIDLEVLESTVLQMIDDRKKTEECIDSPYKGQNAYQLLQVDRGAEPGVIRAAYRYLADKHHPDNEASADPDRFRLLTEAWRVLSDPEKRAEYDKTLESDEIL